MINEILKEDIDRLAASFPMRDDLRGARVLITGATGLMGSLLAHTLLRLDAGIRIVAPLRNAAKAHALFDEDELARMEIVECDLATFDYSSLGRVDYVIHCAAPTASKYFVEHPVETFNIILDGTRRLLDYAREHPVRAMVYLSSLEVYGTMTDDSVEVTEDRQGYLDPLQARSCYPMGKRAAECLCHLYAREYGVNVSIARLTQTNGAGVGAADNRILVQFARLAAEGKDIVLHTKGDSARPYLYSTDGVRAILYLLLKGERGEAYNVANSDTYLSARDLAEQARACLNPSISVRVELNDHMGYAPATRLRLSTRKLEALGWKPEVPLKEMLQRIASYLSSLNQ